MIVVLNKRTLASDARTKKCDSLLYVGRPNVLGNPFKIGQDGDRNQVISKYRKWLWEQIKNNNELIIRELKRLGKMSAEGKTVGLVCWCYPLQCHAEIIARAAEWMIKQD